MLIDGKQIETDNKLDVMNPYNKEVIEKVSVADAEHINEAIKSAEKGFSIISKMPPYKRADILLETSNLIESWKERFAELIAKEAGKPWKYAIGEVNRAKQTFRFASEEAKRISGETIPMDSAVGSEKRKGFFIRQPIGVIFAISPFNFPLNLVAHKIAPAIAVGNSVILKPASATPLTALMLGKILMMADLPPGAVNILIGPGSTVGDALIKDKRIRMITFTGSAEVGLYIKQNSGFKKLTLELGSNSGVIIDKDCDFRKAVARCLIGGFAYQGQVCIHTQRIYVHQKIADRFIQRFVKGAKRLKITNPVNKKCEFGPMIDSASAQKAKAWLNEAVNQNAKVITGGEVNGTFFQPTVVVNARPEMKIVCEETFAPIVTIETFSNFNEAVEKFNQGSRLGKYEYGLAAGIFTNDIKNAFYGIENIETGNVYVNDSATFRVDQMPYGGIRASGIGREGPKFAMEEMTDIKMVSFNLE
ncbi:MAG: aldehyde dehydrogenase [Candidatus Cloacimonadota bacterium]|nr:MAG: aldehyde dehydrogenase [Candidatus Cloacimonadota bacterium]